jgi:putative membrane protein
MRREDMRKYAVFSAVATGGMVLAPSWVRAQQSAETYKYGYGPHMMDLAGGWYGMIFGPLFMILVLAVVIAVAVLLVRWLGGPLHGTNVQPGRTPLDILKERFARGEIDKEEFEDRRRVLGD